jgi:hypothetical protein
MHRLLLIGLSLLTFTFSAGCLFSKKTAKTKENPAMAAEMEENFKVRWIDKRSAELVAQGVTPDASRAQATDEFKVRYGYTSAAQK